MAALAKPQTCSYAGTRRMGVISCYTQVFRTNSMITLLIRVSRQEIHGADPFSRRQPSLRPRRDELSLIATEFDEGAGRETGLKHRGRDVSLHPVLGVFGANASGKSNLLNAFQLMRDAVRGSFADWAKMPEAVPRQPFKLDPTSREETTLLEVDLVLGQEPVRYTYGFELSDERVRGRMAARLPTRPTQRLVRPGGRPSTVGRRRVRLPGRGLQRRTRSPGQADPLERLVPVRRRDPQ